MKIKELGKKVVTPFVEAAETLGEKVQDAKDVRRAKEAVNDAVRAQMLAHGRILREREEAEKLAREAEEKKAKAEALLAEVTVMGSHVAS